MFQAEGGGQEVAACNSTDKLFTLMIWSVLLDINNLLRFSLNPITILPDNLFLLMTNTILVTTYFTASTLGTLGL